MTIETFIYFGAETLPYRILQIVAVVAQLAIATVIAVMGWWLNGSSNHFIDKYILT